eukprot:6640692-Pyramimonas_sp.AAC.1
MSPCGSTSFVDSSLYCQGRLISSCGRRRRRAIYPFQRGSRARSGAPRASQSAVTPQVRVVATPGTPKASLRAQEEVPRPTAN